MTVHIPSTSPFIRRLLERHEELVTQVQGRMSNGTGILANYLGHMEKILGAIEGESLLVSLYIELQGHVAQAHLASNALDAKNGHSDNENYLIATTMCAVLEPYLKGKGYLDALPFLPRVGQAPSTLERRVASADAARCQTFARDAYRHELAIRAVWEEPFVTAGYNRLREVFDRPFAAGFWSHSLMNVCTDGPDDAFRVLIRHLGGLKDPVSLTEEQRKEILSTRIALVRLGLIKQKSIGDEPVSLWYAQVSEGLRPLVEYVGRSLNAWLASDITRLKAAASRYTLSVGLTGAEQGELVDLGLIRKTPKGLKLTERGMAVVQHAVSVSFEASRKAG